MKVNTVLFGDCLVESNKIKDGSVDLILSDLPYGTMNGAQLDGWIDNKTSWDFAIDPIYIYEIANRILRKNGKMVLFSQEPYTSRVITSATANIQFNYRMIWEKDHYANALLCNKAPVYYYEDILVFTRKYDIENLHPLREYAKLVMDFIGLSLKQINTKLGHRKAEHFFYLKSTQYDLCTEQTYNELIREFGIDKMDGFKSYNELSKINATFNATFNLWEGNKYKSNILKYKKPYGGLHPTQKPVLLFEDLIKTFSNENDLVVDFTAGSGTTAIACLNTNRNYILIEKERKYFDIINRRIAEHQGLFKVA